MKIAIVTQPLRHNYGGILQNYALQQVLKGMGHDVETLEILPGTTSWKGKLKAFSKKIFFSIVDEKGRFLHLFTGLSSEQILGKNTRNFIRKHIKLKQALSLPKEGEYDAYIVGSDQVWRPMYSDLNLAFLGFTNGWANVKRIAYAASFGTDEWEYNEEQTRVCKKLAGLFDAVSVREKSGLRLCEDYLNVKAKHVLDPTLLHDREFYEKSLKLNDIPCKKRGVFYYFLDNNNKKEQLVNRIAKEYNCDSYTVNSRVEDACAPIEERVQPPIEEWLRGFRDAEFVVTDSFHGSVFSMVFNKPFAVVINTKRGRARFDSLLNLFGQQYRVIDGRFDNFIDKTIRSSPDVNFKSCREYSMSFLEKYLA